MMAKLVCYRLGNISPTERTNLHRELYGYMDNSNHGRYKYRRMGFLERIRNKKVLDCVIITNSKNCKELIKILRKHKAKISVFDVAVNLKL